MIGYLILLILILLIWNENSKEYFTDRGAGTSMGMQRPDDCGTDDYHFRLMRGSIRN